MTETRVYEFMKHNHPGRVHVHNDGENVALCGGKLGGGDFDRVYIDLADLIEWDMLCARCARKVKEATDGND